MEGVILDFGVHPDDRPTISFIGAKVSNPGARHMETSQKPRDFDGFVLRWTGSAQGRRCGIKREFLTRLNELSAKDDALDD